MNNLNWYDRHISLCELKKGIVSDIRNKEAGVFSNLSAIMLAVSFYLSGMDIASAAEKAGVPVEQASKAIKDENLVKKVKSKSKNNVPKAKPIVSPENKKIEKNDSSSKGSKGPKEEDAVSSDKPSLREMVSAIIEHEGLIPKQTPFRITNESMRKWNKIYGFDISHEEKPSNRKNFIFLKNAEDVVPAVESCLKNYANNPSKYGLSEKSTLKDILMKFDQTGSAGKIKFLRSKFPKLNVDDEFKSFVL